MRKLVCHPPQSRLKALLTRVHTNISFTQFRDLARGKAKCQMSSQHLTESAMSGLQVRTTSTDECLKSQTQMSWTLTCDIGTQSTITSCCGLLLDHWLSGSYRECIVNNVDPFTHMGRCNAHCCEDEGHDRYKLCFCVQGEALLPLLSD